MFVYHSLRQARCLGIAVLGVLLAGSAAAGPPPLLLQTLSGQECLATLSLTGPAAIGDTFTGYLAAGENEIVAWGPHLPVKADTLRLTVPPELQVLRWQDEPVLGGRRWTIQAPRAGQYRLTVTADLAQLTGRFSYRLNWSGEPADLSVWLTVSNALPQPLTLQAVSYQPPVSSDPTVAPVAPLVMAGPLSLPPGADHRRQVATLPALAGEVVYEYDGAAVRERLELSPTPDQVTALVALPPGELTVEFAEASGRQTVAAGTLPTLAAGKLIVALGDTADLAVSRTLLAQRKTELQFDRLGKVSGYDLVEDWRVEVVNYTGAPAKVRVWEIVMAQWELAAVPAPTKLEGGRAAFEMMIGPGETGALEFTLTKHTGSRVVGTS